MEKQDRNKEILLNVEPKETRVAMLKQGKLNNLIVERNTSRQLTGNIYRGKVTNILRNIQSAFIDIKESTNGFIHISDIIENTKKFQEMYELDFEVEEDESKKNADISDLFKKDQPVLVQVVKEAMGTKGARLTSNISLAGRFLVLLPNAPHRGVSRKITDRKVRDKLKKIIKSFEMPSDMGLICRTACIGATTDQLIDEAHDLYRNWQNIVEKFNKADGPALLYQESDIIKRAILLAVDKKYDRILVDDQQTHQICKKIYSSYSSEHPLKIELYRDKVPMFERFMVEREIDKALKRKVWLPSGGYIFIDRTEAMTTIDVNSGRSKSKSEKSVSSVEENLVRINMEAAVETSRQLRLRNIGGLVICDFIDMRSRKNQRRVLDKLKDAMKEDSARCTILGMSEFGLVEMTRQRSRESLEQTLFTPCPYCSGSGMIKSHESVAIEIERSMKKLILAQKQYALRLNIHPLLDEYISPTDKNHLKKLAEELNGAIEFTTDDSLHLNDFTFHSSLNGELLEV
ncbi:MAG: Rne/Rng family ribonuclease [Candidatus Algichlamydia australiensis]|nr:Rne/Rng family ribonuclease [Chlamydiales bacterium]